MAVRKRPRPRLDRTARRRLAAVRARCLGQGRDTLTGDRGKDLFIVASGAGLDEITDFEIGRDLIGLSGLEIADIQVVSLAGSTSSRLEVAGTGEALVDLLNVSPFDLPPTLGDFITEV